MIKYETDIDTIAIQIDFINQDKQHEILHELKQFIFNDKGLFFMDNSYKTPNGIIVNQYTVVAQKTTIMTIVTGITRNKFETIYYIKIRFAGLKRHNIILDTLSHNSFFKMCAYLNDFQIDYKITELDICVDIYAPIDNILVLPIKRTPNTTYYDIDEQQAYKDTKYIEKVNLKTLNNRTSRAYYYNKAIKEQLQFPLTRFELKLNARFFKKGIIPLDMEKLIKKLDSYWILYFNNLDNRNNVINIYNQYTRFGIKDASYYRLQDYRIYPNYNIVIDKFIFTMLDIYLYQFFPNGYQNSINNNANLDKEIEAALTMLSKQNS